MSDGINREKYVYDQAFFFFFFLVWLLEKLQLCNQVDVECDVEWPTAIAE